MRMRPSERHRWSQCSGYPAFRAVLDRSGQLPEDTSSEYAARGSVGHLVCESLVQEAVGGRSRAEIYEWGLDPSATFRALREQEGRLYKPMGWDGKPIAVDADLVADCGVCLHAVAELVAEGGGDIELLTEHTVVVSAELRGTADIVAYNVRTGVLTILDFKFGRGVSVAVRNNPQLQVYAVAVARDLTVSECQLVIVQPRKGGVKTSWHDASEVAAWNKNIAKELVACTDTSRRLSAGSWCRWCPCALACPAVEKAVEEAVTHAQVPVGPTAINNDPALLGMRLRQYEDVLVPWINAVREYLHAQLDHGAVSPQDIGWKLVDKRATRRWKDEAGVVAYLKAHKVPRSMYMTESMLSPAQLERAIRLNGWLIHPNSLEPFIRAGSSGTTLARASDSRPSAPRLVALGALPT